jgi:hypothetical protein
VTHLIKAELRKLTSTQVWFWMLLLAIGLTALFVIGPLASDSQSDLQEHTRDVFLAPITAYIGAFVVGALGITTEFRYQTITPTLLTTPSRAAITFAKLVSYAIVGTLYAAVCVITTFLIASPWLSGKGVTVSYDWDHVWGPLLSVSAAVVLFTILGLGWGALVRNQIVAIAVGVIWVLLAERLIFSIPGIRVVRPYLPVGGLDAVTSPHNQVAGSIHLLGGGPGLLIIAGWALLLAIGGALYSLNRDIS